MSLFPGCWWAIYLLYLRDLKLLCNRGSRSCIRGQIIRKQRSVYSPADATKTSENRRRMLSVDKRNALLLRRKGGHTFLLRFPEIVPQFRTRVKETLCLGYDFRERRESFEAFQTHILRLICCSAIVCLAP